MLFIPPPDVNISANRQKTLQSEINEVESNQVSAEDASLQIALKESLSEQHSAVTAIKCSFCHKQCRDSEELQVHTTGECSVIFDNDHQPVVVSHEETVTTYCESEDEPGDDYVSYESYRCRDY